MYSIKKNVNECQKVESMIVHDIVVVPRLLLKSTYKRRTEIKVYYLKLEHVPLCLTSLIVCIFPDHSSISACLAVYCLKPYLHLYAHTKGLSFELTLLCGI